MNAAQLLAYFDRLAETQGDVPRLHRFIPDLVVRVSWWNRIQEDEPAGELTVKKKQAAD